MFMQTQDTAIERWETPQGTYAVAYDDSPACPAGDFYSGRNCARRENDGHSWNGDTSILDEDHETAYTDYCGYTFVAAAKTKEEAESVVDMYAHWAEGHVYVVGFEPADGGGTDYIHGVYTQDGLSPELEEVKSYFA